MILPSRLSRASGNEFGEAAERFADKWREHPCVACRRENYTSNVLRPNVLDNRACHLHTRDKSCMREIDELTGGIPVDVELERATVEHPSKLDAAFFPQFAAKRGQRRFTTLRRTSWQVQKSLIRSPSLAHQDDPSVLPPDRVDAEVPSRFHIA